jgi:hypothetical protein
MTKFLDPLRGLYRKMALLPNIRSQAILSRMEWLKDTTVP